MTDPIIILAIMVFFTFTTPILGYMFRRFEKYLGIWATLDFLITLIYIISTLNLSDINNPRIYRLFQSPIASSLRFDGLSLFFIVVFLIVSIVSAIHSIGYMEKDIHLTAYYTLMQLMTLGLVGLALADDIFTFFIFWEGMAISSYVLVAFRYHLDEPVEAGIKYIIMSGVGSIVILYGISFIYGVTGGLSIEAIYASIKPLISKDLYIPIIIASLFLVGFGIKAAYFPFWTWLPDAHPAAPSPISALLSGIVIKAGILGIIRFALPIIIYRGGFALPLYVIAIITMTLANLLALMQSDIKRLLAYSSIVNIGFILIGITAAGYGAVKYGIASALTHVFSHALGKGLAFLAAGGIIYAMETREIAKIEGFGRRHPVTGFALALALLSLAGMPPLPGFWSKWFLIFSALDAGLTYLAIIGVFNSVLAVIYYLWLIQRFFFAEPTEYVIKSKEVSPYIKVALILLSAFMILIGVYPSLMYDLANLGASAILNSLPK